MFTLLIVPNPPNITNNTNAYIHHFAHSTNRETSRNIQGKMGWPDSHICYFYCNKKQNIILQEFYRNDKVSVCQFSYLEKRY